MKRCYIRELTDGEHAWDGLAQCDCIMAVALKQQVTLNDLYNLKRKNMITLKELRAIQKMDDADALQKDVEIIKNLAKRYNVKIVKRRD